MKTFGRRRRQDPLADLPPELQRVLAAATAPGHASELTGLGAATAAFTAANPSERAMSRTLTKLIATPVAAVVAVTGLTGGVALAAATGNLPTAAQQLASKIGAPAPGSAANDSNVANNTDAAGAGNQRSATATAALTKPTPGRCKAVTRIGSNSSAAKAAPLSGAGCVTPKVPGSQRSATATANLLNKPAKPGKPATATTGKPAEPGQPAQRPAGSGSSQGSEHSSRPASAGKPAGTGRPDAG